MFPLNGSFDDRLSPRAWFRWFAWLSLLFCMATPLIYFSELRFKPWVIASIVAAPLSVGTLFICLLKAGWSQSAVWFVILRSLAAMLVIFMIVGPAETSRVVYGAPGEIVVIILGLVIFFGEFWLQSLGRRATENTQVAWANQRPRYYEAEPEDYRRKFTNHTPVRHVRSPSLADQVIERGGFPPQR